MLACKTLKMHKMQNLHFYSENIRRRPVKTTEFPRLSQKNQAFSPKKPQQFLETVAKPCVSLTKAKAENRRNRDILAILRETEAQALANYEKIKEKARSRLLNSKKNCEMSNVVGYTLQKIKEISEEDGTEVEEIAKILRKDEEPAENIEKYKAFLCKKIKEEWKKPITAKNPRFLQEKLPFSELSKLKLHNRLSAETEEILRRERGFYLKKLQAFLKEKRLVLP